MAPLPRLRGAIPAATPRLPTSPRSGVLQGPLSAQTVLRQAPPPSLPRARSRNCEDGVGGVDGEGDDDVRGGQAPVSLAPAPPWVSVTPAGGCHVVVNARARAEICSITPCSTPHFIPAATWRFSAHSSPRRTARRFFSRPVRFFRVHAPSRSVDRCRVCINNSREHGPLRCWEGKGPTTR